MQIRPLKFAVVEVTNRCNLRCPHCASASGHARPDEMTLAEMKAVMGDLAALGRPKVTLLGGEFLLRPDWFEIAAAVNENGLPLQLITNGLLVTPEVRARFRELNPSLIGISLDGATPEGYLRTRGVDGYAKLRRLLDELVEDGFSQVNAITTFSSRNLSDFDLFADEFTDTKIVWQIQVAHQAGERFDDSLLLTRDQFAWYVDRVRDCLRTRGNRLRIALMDDFGCCSMIPEFLGLGCWEGCPAGREVIGIRANGDVLPCLSLGSAFIEDNLRRRPLREIWNDPASFPRFRGKSGDLTGSCAKCPHAAVCKAGCSAAALSSTGTLTENTFCLRQVEMRRILDDIL